MTHTGRAFTLAENARAANLTSVAYTRRADATFATPTDALGIAPMMNGGVGLTNGTVFWCVRTGGSKAWASFRCPRVSRLRAGTRST